jgi:hypothetical protein
MGFIIKQPLETNQGLLTEAYARIESYTVNMFYGVCHATVAMYPSKDAAKKTFPVYFGEVSPNVSQVVGVNVIWNDEEIEYPTYFQFPMVKDEEIEIPIIEEQFETKTSTYYDFDENGEIVEKTREEKITKLIQTGVDKITKQKIDINKENVYEFAYNLVKEEFKKIFGDENIIDE